MNDMEKLEIIIDHLNKANFIPAYCEGYARQAIMRALCEIREAEMEEYRNELDTRET